jgi:hypothetical protein
MSTALAEAIPPSNPTIVNGVRMYQSTHGASANNDADLDFTLSVNGSMSDSNGRSDAFTASLVVPAGQSASQVWNTGYPTNDPVGTVITITATTVITGAVSDSKSQTFTITVN